MSSIISDHNFSRTSVGYEHITRRIIRFEIPPGGAFTECFERRTKLHCTASRAGGNERLASARGEALHQSGRQFRMGLLYTPRANELHEYGDPLAASFETRVAPAGQR